MRKVNILKYVMLCLVLGAVIAVSVAVRRAKDTVPPVITCEDEILLVSVADSDDVLMTGIHAVDDRDGDVTASLLIEKKGTIDAEGCRKITYGAFDSSNNVAKYTRTIRYQDYESPHFSLSGALIFQNWNLGEALNMIHAEDCIDGDLSSQIKLYSYGGENTSNYRTLTVYLKNSSGENVQKSFLVELLNITAEEYTKGPKLELKDYLIYMKKGEKEPDWKEYLASLKVVGADRVVTKLQDYSDVLVASNVKLSAAGDYDVTYTYTDEHGYTGKTRLVVIVEE